MSDFDSLVALGWRCDTCKTVYSNGVDECPKQSCKIAKIDSGIHVISKPKQVPAIKNGSKYHYDGFIFDSKPEYERYLTLQPLYKVRIIKHLFVHPTAELLPGVRPTHYKALRVDKPRKLSRITYTPDFTYVFEGVLIVEDVKGTYRKTTKQHKKGDPIITPVARLRHRILQMQRPHIIFDIVKDIEVSDFRWFKKAS